jgi:hypothetical protein
MPKLKTVDGGGLAFQDGKLVLVNDDGTELAFDPLQTHATFGTIRGERDTFKTKAETAEAALALFGKDDKERQAAIEKLKLARSLDQKDLVKAGEIEKLVAEQLQAAQAEWLKKEQGLTTERDGLSSLLDEVLIDHAFSGSKVLDDYFPTWSLLAPIFKAQLGREGKTLVGYRDAAKKDRIYSASKPGELAKGDELLRALLTSHPDHDQWKKGANANGSAAPGNTQTTTSGHTISRDAARDPQQYRAARDAAEKAGVPLQIAG